MSSKKNKAKKPQPSIEPLSIDEIEDLRWYFQDSLGCLGAKSPTGYQLDMLRSGILSDHSHKPTTPPPKLAEAVRQYTDDGDLAEVLNFGLANEKVAMAASRANAVAQRLRKMPRRSSQVLELHFSSTAFMNGVGVDLLAATSAAETLIRKANHKSKHALSNKDWIRWLIAKSGTNAVASACLAQLCEEASNDLKEAYAKYAGTRRRSRS